MNLGFIGLGIMGKPMAHNLIRAGEKLFVHNRSQRAVSELVRAGAIACQNPAEVAAQTGIIFTMLPDSADVERVVLGRDATLPPLVDSLQAGSLLVDLSSIAPETSLRVGRRLAESKVGMLDAPVSGGEPKAIDGTLTIMAGGSQADFDRAEPLLLKMATTAVRVGKLGSGNTAKLANQLVVAANMAALAEAMVLAQKAGVEPQAVIKAIRGGLAGSAVLEAKAGMMLNHDFRPGFRMELHLKDMANVLATANKSGCSLPLTSLVGELMKTALSHGGAHDDHSGILKVFELLNHVQVTAGVEVDQR